MRWCGARAVSATGAGIAVKRSAQGARAHYVDVLLCGHIHDCPCCSVKLRAERGARIEAMLRAEPERWRMLSLTIRHYAGDDLEVLQKAFAKAYARHKRGRPAQRDWSHIGGTCRTWEHTHGAAGWHPHSHTLVYDEHPGELDNGWRRCTSCQWEGPRPHADRGRDAHCPRCARAALKVWSPWVQREAERWQCAVRAELGERHVPDLVHGVDLTEVARARDIGRYLAKMGLGPELAAGAEKRARLKSSRSPWQIAEDLAHEGEERDAALWGQYVRATKGRRAIEMDERAAAKADAAQGKVVPANPFGVELAEPSDVEPLAVEHIPLSSEDLAALRHLERKRPSVFGDVLRIAETHGAGEVEDFCRYAGAVWRDDTWRGSVLHAELARAAPPTPKAVDGQAKSAA